MSDHSPNDPLPALRAQLEQKIAEAPLLAELAAIDAGFTECGALYLTATQLQSDPGRPA